MPALPPPPPAILLMVTEPEPDGSRRVGTCPELKGALPPPAWLRAASHAVAAVDCQHYLYEAYVSDGQYLARYVMLPEGNEAFREIEQVFLFTADPKRKPVELKPADLVFNPDSAQWKGRTWVLADRRELQRP